MVFEFGSLQKNRFQRITSRAYESQPSPPRKADGQNRVAVIAIGTGAGTVLGALFSLARQKRRGGWLLAGTAAAGFLLAGAISSLIPNGRRSWRIRSPRRLLGPLRSSCDIWSGKFSTAKTLSR